MKTQVYNKLIYLW